MGIPALATRPASYRPDVVRARLAGHQWRVQKEKFPFYKKTEFGALRCAGTGPPFRICTATSAPRRGSTLPHLRLEWVACALSLRIGMSLTSGCGTGDRCSRG